MKNTWRPSVPVAAIETGEPVKALARLALLDETGFGDAVHVPLANVAARVALVAKDLGPGPLGVGKEEIVLDHPRLVGVAPRQQRGAGGRADGVRGVASVESHAFAGEPVDVRGPHHRIAIAADRLASPLVWEDDQHVGAGMILGGGARRSESSGNGCRACHAYEKTSAIRLRSHAVTSPTCSRRPGPAPSSSSALGLVRTRCTVATTSITAAT